RSFSRSRRHSLAHLLARHAPQPPPFSHRGWPSHLYSLHGRNRRHFFPYRKRQHASARNLGPPPPRHHSRNQRHLHAHPSRLHRPHHRLLPPPHSLRTRCFLIFCPISQRSSSTRFSLRFSVFLLGGFALRKVSPLA